MKTVFVALVLLGTAVVAAVQPSAPQSVLQISPPDIGFPAWTLPGVQKDTVINLTNPTASDITISAITLVELPNVPPFPAGWLGVAQTAPLVVTAGNTVNLTVQLNKDGRITADPASLSGKIILSYDPPVTGEDTIPIHFTVATPLIDYIWDTLYTACLGLTVAANGTLNFGNTGDGNVNMDFSPPRECDTGSNSRGDATVYLYDGSPVILRKSGGDIVASWSIYSDGFASPYSFKRVSESGPIAMPKWDAYYSGTHVTVDSLVNVEVTWYAPKAMNDTCQFILQKMLVFPTSTGSSVSGLAIGEAIDWDIPTDTTGDINVGGMMPASNMLWFRGFNSADTVTDCADNSLRYAGMAMLEQHMRDCSPLPSPMYGAFNARSDSFVYPTGTFVPSEMWDHMGLAGYVSVAAAADLHGVLIYKNDVSGNGWTLPANDTLTVWTALATTYQGGLTDLNNQIARAKKFIKNYGRSQMGDNCAACGCCRGTTGDVNMDGVVDLRDLSALIGIVLQLIPGGGIACVEEANINASGIIDLGDVSLLIAYLTVAGLNKPSLPGCPSGC